MDGGSVLAGRGAFIIEIVGLQQQCFAGQRILTDINYKSKPKRGDNILSRNIPLDYQANRRGGRAHQMVPINPRERGKTAVKMLCT